MNKLIILENKTSLEILQYVEQIRDKQEWELRFANVFMTMPT